MNQGKRILVLFDGLTVRQEIVQYAIALAQRIDARITLLMLLPNDFQSGDGIEDPVSHGQQVLRTQTEEIPENNIEREIHVRIGDPRSEFYKFMASHRTFHTAIWGGDENILDHGSSRSSDHWIITIKNDLYCPVVTPKKR